MRRTDPRPVSTMMARVERVADQPAQPKRVRVLFWLVVAVLWAILLALVAGVVGATSLAGRPSKVAREVTRGMTADEVRHRVGPPSSTFADATPWQSRAAETPGCGPSDRLAAAWLYPRFLRDDSIVFFDDQHRVLCVHERSKVFHIQSHD